MQWFRIVLVLLMRALPSAVFAEGDEPLAPPAPLLPAQPVAREQWEPGSLYHTRWSPDGEWIVYSVQVDNGDNVDLWLISPESGESRQLTTGPAWDDRVRWSPDSQWITFKSNRG